MIIGVMRRCHLEAMPAPASATQNIRHVRAARGPCLHSARSQRSVNKQRITNHRNS